MKTSALTYILYLLLIGLISAAGYQACKLKQQKALQAKENAAIDQTLRDLGYEDGDSTGVESSSTASEGVYKDGSAESGTKTAVSTPAKDASTTAAVKPSTASTASSKPPVIAKTDDEDEETEASTKPSRSRVRDLDAERDAPKYMVLAGTFKVMDNARSQMETLVKQGFEDAEVGKFNRGKFACTIAKRTNSLGTAQSVLAQLKKKGYKDAIIKSKK